MTPRLSGCKRFLYSLPLWAILIFLGVKVRKKLKKPKPKPSPVVVTLVDRQCTTTMEPRGLYLQDPELGWSYRDGDYRVRTTCEGLDIPLEWSLTIRDGYRITEAPGEAKAREEIWLFGCSFLFGWGIEDDKTAAWLLQTRYPQYTIRNFALPGYGTTQFLVLFEKLLKTRPAPRVAFFAHGQFHAPRNIDPQIMVDGKLLGFPAAVVEGGVLKEIRFVQKAITDDATGVTLAVLKRILDVGRERKVTTVLCYLNFTPKDEDARLWRENGGIFIDATEVDYTNPSYNLKPYDGHPNERAHRIYADKIARVLNALAP